MKWHTMRTVGLTACVAAALVLPATAGARPGAGAPLHDSGPVVATVHRTAELPSSFTTDAQSSYELRAAPAAEATPVVHTVTDRGTQTLAIVLAALALAVALAAACYQAFRVRPGLHGSV